MGPQGKAVAGVYGGKSQTSRCVSIHMDPVTGRFLGLVHRGFDLSSLRPRPRNVLGKKKNPR